MAKGGRRENAGRKSKAEEFGLSELLNTAWPKEKQIEALQHIASFISREIVIKRDPVSGRENISFAIAPKDQLAALRLLLEYGYGKPAQVQVVEHSGRVDIGKAVSDMTDEELRRILDGG